MGSGHCTSCTREKQREIYTRQERVTPDRKEFFSEMRVLHQIAMNVSILYLGLMVWVSMFIPTIGHPRPKPQLQVAAPIKGPDTVVQAWGKPWNKPFGGGGSGGYTRRTTPRGWGRK